MSKRKQKTPVQNKGIPRTSGYVSPLFNVGTHVEALLGLRGKLKSSDHYVDVRIIVPNRDGSVTQYLNRFLRK